MPLMAGSAAGDGAAAPEPPLGCPIPRRWWRLRADGVVRLPRPETLHAWWSAAGSGWLPCGRCRARRYGRRWMPGVVVGTAGGGAGALRHPQAGNPATTARLRRLPASPSRWPARHGAVLNGHLTEFGFYFPCSARPSRHPRSSTCGWAAYEHFAYLVRHIEESSSPAGCGTRRAHAAGHRRPRRLHGPYRGQVWVETPHLMWLTAVAVSGGSPPAIAGMPFRGVDEPPTCRGDLLVVGPTCCSSSWISRHHHSVSLSRVPAGDGAQPGRHPAVSLPIRARWGGAGAGGAAGGGRAG